MLLFSLCLKKATTRSKCCKDASISTTVLSQPPHSSLWHLCQSHVSGGCSLSQHATCHLKIRDNYTVHTTVYWGSFYNPQRAIIWSNLDLFWSAINMSSPAKWYVYINQRSYWLQERIVTWGVDMLSTAASSSAQQAQMVRSLKDTMALHYLSHPHRAQRALLSLSKPRSTEASLHTFSETSHPECLWLWELFITEEWNCVARELCKLFDTFLCGCNCISFFPVVSFWKNAKSLPIKPAATLLCSTFSQYLNPSTPPSSSPVGSSHSVMRGQEGSRQILSEFTASCIQKSLCTRDVFQGTVIRHWPTKGKVRFEFSYLFPSLFQILLCTNQDDSEFAVYKDALLIVILLAHNMLLQALGIEWAHNRLCFNELIKV